MDIYRVSRRGQRSKRSAKRGKRSVRRRTSKRTSKRTSRRTKRVSRRRNVKRVSRRRNTKRVSKRRNRRSRRQTRRSRRVMRGGANHDSWFDDHRNLAIVTAWRDREELLDRLTVNYSRGFVLGRGSLTLNDGSEVKLCGPSDDTKEWNFMTGKVTGSSRSITVPNVDKQLYNLHFVNRQIPSVTEGYVGRDTEYAPAPKAPEPEVAVETRAYDKILRWFKTNGWGPTVSEIVLEDPTILDAEIDTGSGDRHEGVAALEELKFGGPGTSAAKYFTKLILNSKSGDAVDISAKLDS